MRLCIFILKDFVTAAVSPLIAVWKWQMPRGGEGEPTGKVCQTMDAPPSLKSNVWKHFGLYLTSISNIYFDILSAYSSPLTPSLCPTRPPCCSVLWVPRPDVVVHCSPWSLSAGPAGAHARPAVRQCVPEPAERSAEVTNTPSVLLRHFPITLWVWQCLL